MFSVFVLHVLHEIEAICLQFLLLQLVCLIVDGPDYNFYWVMSLLLQRSCKWFSKMNYMGGFQVESRVQDGQIWINTVK